MEWWTGPEAGKAEWSCCRGEQKGGRGRTTAAGGAELRAGWRASGTVGADGTRWRRGRTGPQELPAAGPREAAVRRFPGHRRIAGAA